jgi:raffinose/stachyose/melibiose transport system permease protein
MSSAIDRSGIYSVHNGLRARRASQYSPHGGSAGKAGRSAMVLLLSLGWLTIAIAPLYYLVAVSFEPEATSLFTNPWFPNRGVTLQNYLDVINSGYFRYLLNSVAVAFGATLLTVAVGILGGFAIVRRTGRLSGAVFRTFMVGFAVPMQALMIPLYVETLHLHIYDTLVGLILPMAAFSTPVTMLVMVNFLRDVPSSLIDAMSLDGAGPLRVVVSLVVPISWPAIVTVAIFSLVTDWNNFLFPLILTQNVNRATLPLAVFNFEGNHLSNVSDIMASVVLSALPLWLVYLVARRRIMTGLAAGFGS